MNIIIWISKWIVLPVFFIALLSAIPYWIIKPRQDRNWAPEQALLPSVKVNEDIISISNIRDFKWQEKTQIDYRDMKFELNNIVRLKAVVSHFSEIREVAHVFIIFMLEDGRELGVSVEARKEESESFSITGGLTGKFELMYVLASPDDLLGIRQKNKESLHVYPIKASAEKIQKLFLLIADEVSALNEKPRLYHLLFSNCTNELVKKVSVLTERKYPWFFQTMAPGNTGKILFDLDLIDLPGLTFEQIQTKTLLK